MSLTNEEILTLVRMLETDPGVQEALRAISELSTQARKNQSPAFYTYNKLWRLLAGVP